MTNAERKAANLKLAEDMIQFWASLIDVQLQDYLAAVKAGNLVKTASAAARVIQASQNISEYFREGIGVTVGADQQLLALCKGAAAIVFEVAEKKVSEFYKRSQAINDESDIVGNILN